MFYDANKNYVHPKKYHNPRIRVQTDIYTLAKYAADFAFDPKKKNSQSTLIFGVVLDHRRCDAGRACDGLGSLRSSSLICCSAYDLASLYMFN